MIENGIYKTHWAQAGRDHIWLETPAAMNEWDHLFPRFRVRYSGWSGAHHLDLETPDVAEPLVAVQMADTLKKEYPDWWVRLEDQGSAPYPTRRSGTDFYALDGRKGSIVIRNRYDASVHWEGEPFENGLRYPLEYMRDEPPSR
ncbi:hypothetical protein [Streptomyces sp. NPDC055036]|jgi:hypothetical protein